jgi:hypothetical protein
MGVDMKKQNECGFANSVDLRIHHPANLMIMFSFLVAMSSFPAVFLTSWACFADGAFKSF